MASRRVKWQRSAMEVRVGDLRINVLALWSDSNWVAVIRRPDGMLLWQTTGHIMPLTALERALNALDNGEVQGIESTTAADRLALSPHN